jgi:uncharacterized membrane protein YhaH (DUF805 family)
VTLWWIVLVAGVVVYSASTYGTTLAYGAEQVPRHGFSPDFRSHRAPWWTWILLTVGIMLMVLASMALTGSSGSPWTYLIVFLPCVAISWLAQAAIIQRHNRRVARLHSKRTDV